MDLFVRMRKEAKVNTESKKCKGQREKAEMEKREVEKSVLFEQSESLVPGLSYGEPQDNSNSLAKQIKRDGRLFRDRKNCGAEMI